MKKIVFLVIILLNYILLFSETIIPEGDVLGHWLISNSPYLIEGEITIPDGETLTIDPGVLIEFQNHYKFNIQGNLIAIGNNQDLIKFTVSDTSGYYNNTHFGWHGLRFNSNSTTNDSTFIEYCQFEYGKAIGEDMLSRFGGAIMINNFNKIQLRNCFFYNNYAEDKGGAIYTDSNFHVTSLDISNNRSNNMGGGLFISSNFSLTNSLITNNNAIIGGGLCHQNYDIDLINLTLADNTAEVKGGGLYLNGSETIMLNTICWNNLPQQITTNRYLNQSVGFLTIDYCCVENGEASIDGNNIVLDWQTNNLVDDPEFNDMGVFQYTLSTNSPCIDEGSPNVSELNLPEIDLLGNDRIYGNAIDIGAFEWIGTFTKENELSELSSNLKNYPNPFNPTTTISFDIDYSGKVKVEIYNAKGIKVTTLLNSFKSAGSHSINWAGNDSNGNKVSSGVYFYKLLINNKISDVKKCVLLK